MQQAVEKIAPVRTVEIFQETNEAAVELTEFGVSDLVVLALASGAVLTNQPP